MTALSTLTDVVVRYGGVVAVDRVTIELTEGRIHGLVGPNGSGKSTLLAAMSGLRPADEGSIRFDGQETRRWAPWKLARSGLARTFQGSRVVPELSVRENVLLGYDWTRGRHLLPRPAARRAADQAVETALETCGIARHADTEATALSYGTQRLVEIARAIVAGPRLLLLDEPAAGMNESERGEIERVQDVLKDQGVTQVLVEHNMDMVMRVCSHVFVLNSGQLIASGPPAAIVDDPVVQEAYLGKARDRGQATSDR